MQSRIVLVRHCESSGQHPDAPLTARGRAQARELARWLADLELGVARVVSSPFARALETIEPFATRSGFPIERDARLCERRLSEPDLDDWRDHLERTWRDFDYRAPGGETSREAQTRGRAALDDAAASPGVALLVSHGNLMTLLLNSIDPAYAFDAWRAMTNPDVFALEPRNGSHAIARLWPGDAGC